jgi:hypothetical protein
VTRSVRLVNDFGAYDMVGYGLSSVAPNIHIHRHAARCQPFTHKFEVLTVYNAGFGNNSSNKSTLDVYIGRVL